MASPDQSVASVPTEVRMHGIFETLAAGMTDEARVKEIVDNAIQWTEPEQPCNIMITIDHRLGSIQAINSPARPISYDDAVLLGTLGRDAFERKRGAISGEHGMGGTLAWAALADRQTGRFSIITPYQDEQYQGPVMYDRPNWWHQIQQGESTDVVRYEGTAFAQPTTIIRVEGLSQTAKEINPHRLADFLGYTYSKLIEDGKLIIALLYQPEKAKTGRTIPIEPVHIPLEEGTVVDSGPIPADPADKKGVGPKIHIRHGLIDGNQVTPMENHRDALYGRGNRHPDSSIYARKILFRVGGRVIKTARLEEIKVPYATEKYALERMCVVVDIDLDERITLAPNKDDLDTTNPLSEKIYQQVRMYLAPHVKRLAESKKDDVNLTAKYANRLEQTHDALTRALKSRYSPEGFDAKFGLRRSFLSTTSDPEIPIESAVTRIPERRGSRGGRQTQERRSPQLPGFGLARGPQGRSTVTFEDQQLHEVTFEFLPPIIIDTFAAGYPAWVEERDMGTAEQMPVITLNANNEFVRIALSKPEHDSAGRAMLISAIIQALYQNSYLKTGNQPSLEEIQQEIDETLRAVRSK